jgi:DNA-binding MarR family transcriptional regulator
MGRIHAELKQTRPLASVHEEAMVALVRTTDVVRARMAAVVGVAGITLQQYNVLRILRGAGAAGIPTLDIGARMVERTPGVTRLLDRLEAKRLVRRRRCSEDKRQVLCWITAPGLSIVNHLDRPVRAANERALRGLRGGEVADLIRLLDAVRADEPAAAASHNLVPQGGVES